METQAGEPCQNPDPQNKQPGPPSGERKSRGAEERKGRQQLHPRSHSTYLVIRWPVADAEHRLPTLADEGSLGLNLLLGDGLHVHAAVRIFRVESLISPYKKETRQTDISTDFSLSENAHH